MSLPWPNRKIQNPLVLPPGYLRTEIRIEAQSSAEDASGGVVATWTKVLAAMAAVEFVASVETYQQPQFTGEVTHKIVLRWPGELGIQGGNRVIVEPGAPAPKTYLVQTTVNLKMRNRVLWLMCIELDGSE